MTDAMSIQPSKTIPIIFICIFYFYFSGIDIPHGCMPNKYSHILFGKLESLPNTTSHHYHGDRIYIKPEPYGLQQFGHYLMRK
jgi:hypothetical protein